MQCEITWRIAVGLLGLVGTLEANLYEAQKYLPPGLANNSELR
jgi:hypothetical protein